MDNKIQNIYDDPYFFECYQKHRKNKEGFNDELEQPAIISLLPNLLNLKVLDIGCGFGDFCRYVIGKGAVNIVGIDPSEKMIHAAKTSTNNVNITFIQSAVEKFESPSAQFDLVVSSLALHYVENFNEVVKKIFSWMKPKGFFIFSVEHPIRTASLEYPEIMKDEHGENYHAVYNYRDEILLHQHWFIDGVQKYHRTISTYINTLIEHGFTIEKVLEPMPDDELIKRINKFSVHKVRPPILIIKARKDI